MTDETQRSRVKPLDFIVQPQIEPALSAAPDRYLRRVVGRRSRARNATLRVYAFAGDCLSLGRYHLVPSAPAGANVTLHRRHTGGRAFPAGDGFVGVSLVLPHRSALFSNDPFALAPGQVLNRHVRGLMRACRPPSLSVSYPGRDVITIDRRIVAGVSFDTDEQGTLLFEAIVANTRDFSILPDLLEAIDRNGVVKAELLTPADTTCLARELGAEFHFDDVAAMIREGYARHLGLDLVPRRLTALEEQAIRALAAREFGPERWLHGRARSPELDLHAATWAQLGVFEAFFAVRQERFINEILFAGDFIANSAAVAALERKLRLCPLDWRAINTVVNSVFEGPANYLLGVGKLRVIADLLTRSAPR
jgi:lipoate-protein ligase A